jgi:hypothetical protein
LVNIEISNIDLHILGTLKTDGIGTVLG